MQNIQKSLFICCLLHIYHDQSLRFSMVLQGRGAADDAEAEGSGDGPMVKEWLMLASGKGYWLNDLLVNSD